MLKTPIVLCAIGLAAATTLHAAQTIEAEKMTRAELRQALKTAPDDTVIEFLGVKKTKAQWRSEESAGSKPMNAAQLKERERERNSRIESRQKELDYQQDAHIEAENAETMVKFDQLRLSQGAKAGR